MELAAGHVQFNSDQLELQLKFDGRDLTDSESPTDWAPETELQYCQLPLTASVYDRDHYRNHSAERLGPDARSVRSSSSTAPASVKSRESN